MKFYCNEIKNIILLLKPLTKIKWHAEMHFPSTAGNPTVYKSMTGRSISEFCLTRFHMDLLPYKTGMNGWVQGIALTHYSY
jgi:hypothetical protein